MLKFLKGFGKSVSVAVAANRLAQANRLDEAHKLMMKSHLS